MTMRMRIWAAGKTVWQWRHLARAAVKGGREWCSADDWVCYQYRHWWDGGMWHVTVTRGSDGTTTTELLEVITFGSIWFRTVHLGPAGEIVSAKKEKHWKEAR